ncbi:hypothetical protein B9Y66_12160 [Stenotrophomonas maltophilia]|uniref:hypothetical protein n=1 Tax=Stenotrophomonas sp. PA-6-5C TaxID=2665487 RepID=UPI000C25895B|nr:hypothetical protein [Stenotrophomonas sp. PA-6-5C]MCF5089079.1 hypothetical protein [Stenotrophomonas sp. PA-6-5C]PJL09902.1 hypothetical protein B9Y66_12160 [Stenotrophomonas maltophilia]
MTASQYPYLFATLGEAANQLPEAVARALETTLTATQVNAPSSTTLLGCLQRIRKVDAADGQPWPTKGHTPGQRMAMARIDRANSGLTLLLEILHATERVRVDGDADQQIGEDVREGLLLACRGLAEYMEVQVRTL